MIQMLLENFFEKLSYADILKISIIFEEKAKAFYQRAYEFSQKPQEKEFLRILISDEERHAREFQRLYEQYQNDSKFNESYFSLDSSNCIRKLVTGHIYPAPNEELDRIEKISSVLGYYNFALKAENDAIFFYDEVVKTVTDCDTVRKVFAKFVMEEKMHKQELQNKIDKVLYTK